MENAESTLPKILGDLDSLWSALLTCRAYTPYLDSCAVGRKQFVTSDYYDDSLGFGTSLEFDSELTRDDVDRLNGIGHWINENFVIRLCAILEEHNLKNDINESLDGGKYVTLVYMLRNCFVHRAGKSNTNCRRASEKMRELGLPTDCENGMVSLPIDVVLEKLHTNCKAYAEEKYPKPKDRT